MPLWLGVDILVASYDSALVLPFPSEWGQLATISLVMRALQIRSEFFFTLIRVSTSQVRKGGSDLITVGITIMCIVRRRSCDF